MSNRLFTSISHWSPRQKGFTLFGLMVAVPVLNALFAAPAFAHHPFGGSTPENAIQGFLSGLGHPVIGVDHLLFTIATGLLAVGISRGFVIPVAFATAGLLGTGLHLMGLDLPAPESIISLSVVIFGALLAARNRPEILIVSGLAVIAGVFHGYAYGEAIVGAEMTPTFAYLVGFTGIQLAIALGAYVLADKAVSATSAAIQSSSLPLRFSGFAILGAGAALLSSILLG